MSDSYEFLKAQADRMRAAETQRIQQPLAERISELERQLAEAQAEVRELGHQRTELKRCLAEAQAHLADAHKERALSWSRDQAEDLVQQARATTLEEAAKVAEAEGARVQAPHEDYDEARRIAAAIRALAQSASPDGEK